MSLIQTQEELDIILESMLGCKIISIDTEFHRKNTYYSILCTIQVGFMGSEFVIDYFENLDLTIFKDILQDGNVIKIFHASQQDIPLLEKTLDIQIQNIFDTQYAAMFLGYGYTPSLAEVCQKTLNIKLDKEMQYTNWFKRPLSVKQIEYAALDVKYLEQIYEIFLTKLKETRRYAWFREEMAYLIDKPKEKHMWYRIISKPHSLSEYKILRHLTTWRDNTAKFLDIAPNILLSDGIIKNLASNSDFKKSNWMELFPVEISVNLTKEYNLIREYHANTDLKAVVKLMIDYICKRKAIPTNFFATNEEIMDLVISKGVTDRKIMKGWRYELITHLLVDVIKIS